MENLFKRRSVAKECKTPKTKTNLLRRKLTSTQKAKNNSLESGSKKLPYGKVNKSYSLLKKKLSISSSKGSEINNSSNRNISLNSSGSLRRNLSNFSAKSPSRVVSTELQYPLNSRAALLKLSGILNNYEKLEIIDYPVIYYAGTQNSKLKPNSEEVNNGYDDERGDYKLVRADHIAYRYEIVKILGKGSFGQVVECHDHKRKENIALKIIRNKRRFHSQAAIEVKILQALREFDQGIDHRVIKIKNSFVFRNHICIVFELLSLNLYDLLKNVNFIGLSLQLIQSFAGQVLKALDYCNKLSIIHCDLKPENILLESAEKSLVKVIDFGSACFSHERIYTYIQSRFYRAPEIILGIPYTTSIDMWSFGCVLVELFTGKPVFPGESEHEQLLIIMEYLGYPPAYLMPQASRSHLFFKGDSTLKTYTVKGKKRFPGTKNLRDFIKCSNEAYIDLIVRCFDWDPQKRIKPNEALNHPFILEKRSPRVVKSISKRKLSKKRLK